MLSGIDPSSGHTMARAPHRQYVTVPSWTTQLGHAATSHSWQRAAGPGCSRVTPHSHVVDMADLLLRLRLACLVYLPSRVRALREQINNVIVFISGIN